MLALLDRFSAATSVDTLATEARICLAAGSPEATALMAAMDAGTSPDNFRPAPLTVVVGPATMEVLVTGYSTSLVSGHVAFSCASDLPMDVPAGSLVESRPTVRALRAMGGVDYSIDDITTRNEFVDGGDFALEPGALNRVEVYGYCNLLLPDDPGLVVDHFPTRCGPTDLILMVYDDDPPVTSVNWGGQIRWPGGLEPVIMDGAIHYIRFTPVWYEYDASIIWLAQVTSY